MNQINVDLWKDKEEWIKKVEDEGETYIKVEKVIIKRVTEPTEIQAEAMDNFLSDGTAPKRIVQPGGLVLFGNGNYPVTEEELGKYYIPYRNESGKIEPDTYLSKKFVKVYKFQDTLILRTDFGRILNKYSSLEYCLLYDGINISFWPIDVVNKYYQPYEEEKTKSSNKL